MVLGVCEARNGHGFSVPQVGPMLGEKAAHGQSTDQFGTTKNTLNCS